MTCTQNSLLEERALEKIQDAYCNFEIDFLLYSNYFDWETQYRIKEEGSDTEENEIGEVFDWLLARDYEYAVTSPVSALRYYAEEYYAKYNR